ncbi:uncharacterized protein LOC118434509 [Folsomia candida]|uniref:uncharacterized protein LOC118434509 n=1 Tax=Folsomia candida TaxID=158441 RepID=UPI00160502B2|nr:uncharacterized protein LOC118434509 [Folsomia candida]
MLIQPLERGWARYIPQYSFECDGRYFFPTTPLFNEFVDGMHNNEVAEFTVNYQLNVEDGSGRQQNNGRRKSRQSLVCMILKADLKKISVVDDGIGLTITKNNNPLLPWDPPGGANQEFPLRVTINKTPRPVEDIILDINRNARFMITGPGTFSCRESHCVVTSPLLTRSASVQWGTQQHQVCHQQKRYTCRMNDLVYLCHCNACLQLPIPAWTTYIGESYVIVGKNVHARWHNHLLYLTNFGNRNLYTIGSALLDDAVAVILGPPPTPDVHDLLRDIAVHFTCIHADTDRRYTILQQGFGKNAAQRRAAENQWIIQCGNGVYDEQTGFGNLNL